MKTEMAAINNQNGATTGNRSMEEMPLLLKTNKTVNMKLAPQNGSSNNFIYLFIKHIKI